MRTTNLNLLSLAQLQNAQAFQVVAIRTGTGLATVVAVPPARDTQSPREHVPLSLPKPEPKPDGVNSDGRDMRSPDLTPAPASSAGRSSSGSTASPKGRTTAARFSRPTPGCASDYPSLAAAEQGGTRCATPSYRRWHPASVRLSMAAK